MLNTQGQMAPPEVHVFPVMANWYCERCKKYIASVEILSGHIHENCGGKVIWKEYHLQSCPPWYRQVTTIRIPGTIRIPSPRGAA